MRAGLHNRVYNISTTVWRDLRGEEISRRSKEEHIRAAVRWLYEAQDATEVAGVAADYNLVLGWNDPYPETTGYIIPTMYDYAHRTGESEAASRAEDMAEWLLSIQRSAGWFPAGTYTGGDPKPSVFNTGQILRGLVRTHQETGCSNFRSSAMSAVNWLAEVQNEDGSWEKFDYRETSHAYSSRISWPILEVATEYDLDIGFDVASSNLSWVIDQQRPNGWFDKSGFDAGDKAYLHTIAYTIRGLLESAEILVGDISSQCRTAAELAANNLASQQHSNGILPGIFDSEWTPVGEYQCLSGNAQMAIVWAQLFDLTGNDVYLDAVEDTIRYLKTAQTFHGSHQIYGGIRGSNPVWGRYMYLRYPNWAAKFYIDMLLVHESLCK